MSNFQRLQQSRDYGVGNAYAAKLADLVEPQLWQHEVSVPLIRVADDPDHDLLLAAQPSQERLGVGEDGVGGRGGENRVNPAEYLLKRVIFVLTPSLQTPKEHQH